MPSLDFEAEKARFREFYDANATTLRNASRSLSSLLTDLLSSLTELPISKIEARVKEREECIKKFNRKYRADLEAGGQEYEIKDKITDLIGARIVCLYEDDIEKIGALLEEQFQVVSITDKIASIENTEGSFGYKGLHYDIRLRQPRADLPEYVAYTQFPFEVQVRTIVQDSWSVLDHKIKYKKSIPTPLKRRINTLAALFELADHEFRQIRDSTTEEIEKVEEEPDVPLVPADISGGTATAAATQPAKKQKLNAFNFLKIVSHFFPGQEFEAHKVDGFVQDIIDAKPTMTRAEMNDCLRTNIALVKRYQVDLEANTDNRMNAFTLIRHCLYKSDTAAFQGMLTNVARETFKTWLAQVAPEAT